MTTEHKTYNAEVSIEYDADYYVVDEGDDFHPRQTGLHSRVTEIYLDGEPVRRWSDLWHIFMHRFEDKLT